MTTTTTNNDAARDAGRIPVAEVRVKLERIEPRVYAVLIASEDRDYCFEDEVSFEVAVRIKGKKLTHSSGNGITVFAPKGFRAPRGYRAIESLS